MSSKYAPTVNPGDKRCRVHSLSGFNRLAQAPSMVFNEEQVVLLLNNEGELEERTLARTRSVRLAYDPLRSMDIRNPENDQIGAVGRIPADLTMAEAFAVLYSLGRLSQIDDDERLRLLEISAAENPDGTLPVTPEDLENPIPEGE